MKQFSFIVFRCGYHWVCCCDAVRKGWKGIYYWSHTSHFLGYVVWTGWMIASPVPFVGSVWLHENKKLLWFCQQTPPVRKTYLVPRTYCSQTFAQVLFWLQLSYIGRDCEQVPVHLAASHGKLIRRLDLSFNCLRWDIFSIICAKLTGKKAKENGKFASLSEASNDLPLRTTVQLLVRVLNGWCVFLNVDHWSTLFVSSNHSWEESRDFAFIGLPPLLVIVVDILPSLRKHFVEKPTTLIAGHWKDWQCSETWKNWFWTTTCCRTQWSCPTCPTCTRWRWTKTKYPFRSAMLKRRGCIQVYDPGWGLRWVFGPHLDQLHCWLFNSTHRGHQVVPAEHLTKHAHRVSCFSWLSAPDRPGQVAR